MTQREEFEEFKLRGNSKYKPHDDSISDRHDWAVWQAAQPVQPAANQKLLQIIAAAYQIAGVYDAPGYVLDVLANPAAATQDDIDALLPFVTAQPSPALDLSDTEALNFMEHDRGERVLSIGSGWYSRSSYGKPLKRFDNLRAAINAKGMK